LSSLRGRVALVTGTGRALGIGAAIARERAAAGADVFEDASPQGRVGRPEDAARLVRFLATDDAAWITGQILRSRGGMG